MKIATEPQGDTVIEFDKWDGYEFATRPSNGWPGSSLRANGPDNKTVTLDADGDLVDSGNIPDDCDASELSAFIHYALNEARSQIDELLTIEERKHAGGSR